MHLTITPYIYLATWTLAEVLPPKTLWNKLVPCVLHSLLVLYISTCLSSCGAVVFLRPEDFPIDECKAIQGSHSLQTEEIKIWPVKGSGGDYLKNLTLQYMYYKFYFFTVIFATSLIPLYVSSHFVMDSHIYSCFLSSIHKTSNIFAFMLPCNVLLLFSSFTFLEE